MKGEMLWADDVSTKSQKCWRYVRSYYEFKTICLFKVCA